MRARPEGNISLKMDNLQYSQPWLGMGVQLINTRDIIPYYFPSDMDFCFDPNPFSSDYRQDSDE